MRSSLLLTPLVLFGLASCGAGTTFTPGADGGADDAATTPLAEGGVTPEGGATDASPNDAVDAIYFGACLSTLAAGRLDRVLRFYTRVKYTPSVPTLEIELTALRVGADSGPPATVSKSETVGQTYTSTGSVSASGVFAGVLGTVTIPGAANPISGRDIVIEQTAVPGRFMRGKFCSQLSGHVVTPTDIPLDGDSNTCIYLPVKDGDPTPAIEGSDFPRTCALN